MQELFFSIDGKKYPSVSAPAVGDTDAQGETAIMIVYMREGAVAAGGVQMLTGFAAETLVDNRVRMEEFADQLLVPHPVTGELVEVRPVLFQQDGGWRLAVMRPGSQLMLYVWSV